MVPGQNCTTMEDLQAGEAVELRAPRLQPEFPARAEVKRVLLCFPPPENPPENSYAARVLRDPGCPYSCFPPNTMISHDAPLGGTVSIFLLQIPVMSMPLTSTSATLCHPEYGLRPGFTDQVLKITMLDSFGQKILWPEIHAQVKPPREREVQTHTPCHSITAYKGRLGPAVPPNARLAQGPSSSAGIRDGQCVRDAEEM